MTTTMCDFGVIGLGVMGQNLALNVADHGFRVAVWNRKSDRSYTIIDENPDKPLTAAESLRELVKLLDRPRKILVMIKAGAPVDEVLETLIPMLDAGDIVIDGGNSWFKDTQRREALAREHRLNFFGVGVSGGEEGARFGPSLMPGGDKDAYRAIAPILEAIAARTESGPCVTHVGSDGAGHFVKMVHNGIEYADMQLIAEVYDILLRGVGLDAEAMAEVFRRWNEGPLASFLIEITAKILTVSDTASGEPLVFQVLDKAGQKGTGRWTAQVALDYAVAVPTIAAAVDARVLSSYRSLRLRFADIYDGPSTGTAEVAPEEPIQEVHDALVAAKIVSYAQGLDLIRTASKEHGWNVDLCEIARIWKGGCIIRAKLLDEIMQAYKAQPDLPHLLLAPAFAQQVADGQLAWRRIVSLAAAHGIPVPALSAGLSYFDSLRTARLPQNLTQAQRDAFGAHTYQRLDDPDGPFIHTDWLDN
ncbi:MAG: NADP-dependent phosphogluconate dehydrogenase [Myxococcales bacterium]|nr:NADP-dependent phosphogluconate dehydrogenase [Myxococcales bacterium]